MRPEVSIITVAYRNEETIVPCLTSIRQQVTLPYEVIAVDNSPDNLTALKVRDFMKRDPRFPITFLKAGQNTGFAKGCNSGAARARGDYFMFLNPDTILKNDAARLLTDFLKSRPTAGVVGPMILDPAGRVVRTCRNLPTVARIILDVTGLDRFIGAYVLARFPHDRPRRVEQVIGACFFLHRHTFMNLGGFDERFFMYFEEVDFCKRLIDSGAEIWFRPEARVMHRAEVSTRREESGALMIQALRHSRSLYFEKHFGRTHQLLLNTVNRLEGLGRGLAFYYLYLCRGQTQYLAKARGYFNVLLC
ncbi:MAG: glycosyltransferase family 2 protein [Desulfobacteraceae bacterium]|jgi:GT2 family glycosyltransferase|nr:glycosyltransferase family 2 protein [Desulfobacteraceae bacterium]